MINVFDSNGEIIGRVASNANLDRWDGNNFTSGSTGRHKGITRLADGRYVLIHTTQWQGEQDHAETITAEQALQEILAADSEQLLDEPKFADLKELWEQTLVGEME